MSPAPGAVGPHRARAGALPGTRIARALLIVLGWLAACGIAFANEGRLILVTGQVTLVRSTPGQPVRTLVPEIGTVVAGGDALVTGVDGRVQVAFSDGSLLSLQPRSEFRIDDYRFDADAQRGFFFLVRGALRTISGAIGKREPDDYRMSTPTANIGIRGTEFVAEETVCDPACHPGRTPGLRVAVSAGRVVVYNAAGSTEVAAGGATYVAGPSSVPVPTSERPTLSTAPSRFDQGATRLAQTGPVPGGPRARNQQAPREFGEGLPPGVVDDWRRGPLASQGDSASPAYVVAAAVPAQVDPRARTAPPKSGRTGSDASPGSRESAPKADDGTSPAADTMPGSAPGAVTPGHAGADTSDTPLRAVGDPSAGGPSAGGLPADGSSVGRDPDGGRTDPAPLDFNRPTAQPKAVAQGGGNGGAEDDEEADGPGSGGPIASDVLSPSGDGTIATPIGNAPGAGEQRGPDGKPIVVVAAGGCRDLACQPGPGGVDDDDGGGNDGGGNDGGGNDSGGNDGGGNDGGGNDGGGNDGGGNDGGGGDDDPPPVLTPGLNSAARVSVRTLQSPWLDVNLDAANAHVHLDSEYRLESIGLCPTILCISRGTASVAEAGHTADVAWGRWVNGTARVTVIGLQSNRHLGANNGVHYLVGVPTVAMPTSGTAYYTVAGATAPTFASGAVSPGTFTGQGLVQFAAGQDTRIGLRGDITFQSGEHYQVFSNGARVDDNGRLVAIGNSQIRMTGRTSFSGTLGVSSVGGGDRLQCAGGDCQAKVDGGFYGPNAASMGMGYSVGKPGGGDTINGVAVFHRR